ncbi:signal peptidase II [bacterium D16-54]|nr:signal peptidase II [bacterium D16-54]RKJ11194.1 signal peptidase II [bacterium D16-56]
MNSGQRQERRKRVDNLIVWAVFSCFLVLLDQYTKHLAVIHLKGQRPLVILQDVFELLYSENRGAAFGMLQGQQFFFFIIGILVLLAASYGMWRIPSWKDSHYCWLGFCIMLITAGAAGNMLDRVSQGYVVDFLYFVLIDFPIFNVADIYVTTATAVLLILLLFYYTEEDLEIFHLTPKVPKQSEDEYSIHGADTKR